MARLLLTASVALNLLLLTTIVAARVDLARSQPAGDHRSGSALFHDPVPLLESSTHIAELYARLRAAGIGRAAARPLIGAWLARRKAENLRREVMPYWRSHDSAVDAARSERLARESAMRRALVSIYGGAAALDPYFAMLFEPLGPRFSFLTSEQQVALEQALVAGGTDTVASVPAACLASGDAQAGPPAGRPAPDLEALGTAARFEYGLRVSPRAAELRRAGLGLDEAEFREAFGLLAQLDAAPSLAAHARARAALKALLGAVRFDRLWSQRDPVYAEVVRVLQRRGRAPRVIEAAYAVMNRAQERLLEAAQRAGDPARLGEVTQRIVEEERLELEAVVGAAAARALVAARAGLATRSQAAECRVSRVRADTPLTSGKR